MFRKNKSGIIPLAILALFVFSCGSKSYETKIPGVDMPYEYQLRAYDSVMNLTSDYWLILGDIQNYGINATNIGYLQQVVDWFWSQREAGVRIQGCLQLGDLTQDNVAGQWRIFNFHFLRFRQEVPMPLCLGNHDYPSVLGIHIQDRALTLFNDYVDYTQEKVGLVSSFQSGRQENALLRMEVAGTTIYVLSLEYAPRDEVIEWANVQAKQYADSPMILLTHAYLTSLEQRYPIEPAGGRNLGEALWNRLVKGNDNIRTVVCGHCSLTGLLQSENDAGHTVTQIMHDPQYEANGGDTWIQIWEFLPQEPGTIQVCTYNIRCGEFSKHPSSSFRFRYK